MPPFQQSPAARTLLGVMLPTILMLGCSGDNVAPVSGRVTVDGEPLVGASVTFEPIGSGEKDGQAGGGSYGRTDSDGRFDLKTVFSDKQGAVVGRHKVLISTEGFGRSTNSSDDNRRATLPTLPSRYRDGSVKFEVPPSGTDEANFELTSTPTE